MREIKFRGRTAKGMLIFGDLSYSGGKVFIGDYRVEPETVSQLCGYDANHDEVYEGDTLQNSNGEETQCFINYHVNCDSEYCSLPLGKVLPGWVKTK